MTIFAGPFDGGNMFQAEWEEIESKVWRDGVIAGARNTFTVTTTTGLGISVNTGDAIVDGFRFYADATTPLTAATADPSLPRIDLVVLRIDEAAHTSTIDIKTGTPAGSPVAPTVTQTVGGTYEVGIYQVRVNAGATSITSLTDVRTYAAPTNSAQLTGATFTGLVTTGKGLVAKTLSATVDDSIELFDRTGTLGAILGWKQSGGGFYAWDNVNSAFVFQNGTKSGILFSGTVQAASFTANVDTTSFNATAFRSGPDVHSGSDWQLLALQNGGMAMWDNQHARNLWVANADGSLTLNAGASIDTSGHVHDSAGQVTVQGSHTSVTPVKLSAGTALPGTLDANEVFFLLA